MKQVTAKPFTGHHMTAILVAFFGVVIAVNLTMARMATSGFGGTVVENSYVASQNYNSWLAQADAQARLGWTVGMERARDGKLLLTIKESGLEGQGFVVTAQARHPLGRTPQQALEFEALGRGQWLSRRKLAAGRIQVHVKLVRGSERFRTLGEVQ